MARAGLPKWAGEPEPFPPAPTRRCGQMLTVDFPPWAWSRPRQKCVFPRRVVARIRSRRRRRSFRYPRRLQARHGQPTAPAGGGLGSKGRRNDAGTAARNAPNRHKRRRVLSSARCLTSGIPWTTTPACTASYASTHPRARFELPRGSYCTGDVLGAARFVPFSTALFGNGLALSRLYSCG